MTIFEHYGKSSAAKLSLDQSIVCLEVTGILSIESVSEFAGPMIHSLGGCAPLAAAMFYDRADWCLSMWDLFQILKRMNDPAAPAHTPCAVVVPIARYNDVHGYCETQARDGVSRKVFTERAAAVKWAKEQAALRHLQRLHRMKLQGKTAPIIGALR